MDQVEAAIQNYKMSDGVSELVRSTKLLLIAGVVGGGKNTVINELIHDDSYHLIVSHTTRASRTNHGIEEINGVDYHFVTLEQIEQMLSDKSLVEAKYVHGNVYATSAAELAYAKETDKVAVTDVNIHGVMEYLNVKPDTHAIFLLPPSVETWLKRLERRYGDMDAHRDEIDRRLKTAYSEIQHIQADARFIIIINDDLATTVERIEGVLAGDKHETSEYADAVTEHLLTYLESHLSTH